VVRIIQIATTLVFADAFLATIATIAAGPAAAARRTVGEASPDSEPGRCVRVLGCALEPPRQQAPRVVTDHERCFRQARMRKECDPITDPELRNRCLERFNQG
jgi:hypothetical protein